MTRILWCALLAAALVVAGCGMAQDSGNTGSGGETSTADGDGSGPDGSSYPEDSLAAQLSGRSFESTDVTGHELVADTTIGLRFSDDAEVGVSAGCNHLGGTAEWQAERLTLTGGSMTEMGCDPDRMEQDSWIMSWLGEGVDVALYGNQLTLDGGDVVIELTDRRALHPDKPLVGTEWQLNGIIAGTGDSASVSSVPQGLSVTMQVFDDHLEGFDGVNRFGVRPADGDDRPFIDGDTVHAAEMDMTAVGCATEEPCSVDVSVLGSEFTYSISENRLTVDGVGPTEGQGLVFLASGPDGDAE